MKLSHLTALTLLFGIWVSCTVAEPAHESHNSVNVLFSTPLQDVPGKQMVVVQLELKPKGQEPAVPHRHPGSVFVYVTQGTARLGIEGQPVQVVSAGQTFFEPPGALHIVAESASETQSAKAIAVVLAPIGAPIVTIEPKQ